MKSPNSSPPHDDTPALSCPLDFAPAGAAQRRRARALQTPRRQTRAAVLEGPPRPSRAPRAQQQAAARARPLRREMGRRQLHRYIEVRRVGTLALAEEVKSASPRSAARRRRAKPVTDLYGSSPTTRGVGECAVVVASCRARRGAQAILAFERSRRGGRRLRAEAARMLGTQCEVKRPSPAARPHPSSSQAEERASRAARPAADDFALRRAGRGCSPPIALHFQAPARREERPRPATARASSRPRALRVDSLLSTSIQTSRSRVGAPDAEGVEAPPTTPRCPRRDPTRSKWACGRRSGGHAGRARRGAARADGQPAEAEPPPR